MMASLLSLEKPLLSSPLSLSLSQIQIQIQIQIQMKLYWYDHNVVEYCQSIWVGYIKVIT